MGRRQASTPSPKYPALKLDGKSGRYVSHFRNERGYPDHKWFTRDERESRLLWAAWITARYSTDVPVVVPELSPLPNGQPGAHSLISIAVAYTNEQHKRRRGPQDRRKPDTICTRQYHNICSEVDHILNWAKEHFGEAKLRRTPFARLWDIQAYHAMMQGFTQQYDSLSQINKHRIRFWALAEFASLPPYSQVLPFQKKQVRRFGGKEKPKPWTFPPPEDLQALLRLADTRMRCWIWMALGMAFGPGDIAECRSAVFDQQDFNYERHKSPGIHRYGPMRPMTWAWIQTYLAETPRKPSEMMFVNENGLAFNRDEDKTQQEMEFGTVTHDAKPIPYKHTDGIGRKFRELQAKAGVSLNGGFYLLRHIACTAFAKRDGVTPADLVTFMGHARLEEMKKYLMPLSPQNKPAVLWVNRMLDAADPMAWNEDLPQGATTSP